MFKKIILIALSALAIPVGIAIIGGGGYILFHLLGGVPINESIQSLQGFQEKVKPYMSYMIVIFAIPLVLKGLRKSQRDTKNP